MSAHDAAFDKIMEIAGNDGKFQWRFNSIYNVAMVICGGMSFMNIILALNVPDHWCLVPGRENTNYTIDQWKQLTLPRETDDNGIKKNSLSKCKMYNVNWTTIQTWDYENWNSTKNHEKLDILAHWIKWNQNHFNRWISINTDNDTNNNTTFNMMTEWTLIHCDIHEFDKQWYESTIVSQEDWVCSKDLYQTNAFALNRIGEVIGCLFLSPLGDKFGRRGIFYASVASIVLGRILMIWSTSHETWFFVASIIGSLCSISLFNSPFIIAMEISKPKDRANVAIMQNLAWTVGLCILPMIYWYYRAWLPFFIVSTIPLAIFLFIPTYMIESPRWLVNRGQLDKAAFYLNRIAKINGKTITINKKFLQSMLPACEPEKTYGMLSLFSAFRLAKNTTIIIICWMIGTLSYFTLILYISQTEGNPFLNFFFQSAIEAPAFFLGTYMANTIGRRWTNCFSFIMASLFCIPSLLLINHSEWSSISLYSIMVVKFWIAITFFAVNLQAMETYPTCLRQTGLSIGTVGANIIGVLGPYITYWGTKYDNRYPILILLTLFVFGSVVGLFLPETLHQKLPDSLEEAKLFGANQKFWSFPRRPKDGEVEEKKENVVIDELERLNPLL